MNISHEWLKAFVPSTPAPKELRDLLTMHVATVDEMTSMRADLAPIVVARVVEEGPHPDSDHLHLTKVDAGTGVLLEVVCGAPNVKAGGVYPFAKVGTTLTDGKHIEKRKIRGIISNGMLCSPREIGLGQDHDGLLELYTDAPPGTPLLSVLSVGDTRLVLDVGANRPDLLSHLGMAREVAAATKSALALPHIEGLTDKVPAPKRTADTGDAGGVAVRTDRRGLAHRFMGVVIRGVKVGPSPEWLVRRLESVGSRSINNVVDASNYVLHELGQPTHAFDVAKLAGPAIIVRRAAAGETITTLDGVDRKLTADMIVIADAERPQAVAGVMGGQRSEVTDATTDVFLEVANFDQGSVRATRRALGLNTDASYRFERGVDVEIAPVALKRLANLILLLAGGRIDGAPVDLLPAEREKRTLHLRPDRVRVVLGDVVPEPEIERLLTSVGFEKGGHAREPDRMTFVAPTWRSDVTAEVDLIEEVARLRGFDSFPDELRPYRSGNVPDHPQWLIAKAVREVLVGQGFLEVRPMPFTDDQSGPRVLNPLADNEAHLRRTVLETLARRAEYNLARMHRDIRLFEIGSVFQRGSGVLPQEELHVAAVVLGRRQPPHFTDPKSDEFSSWSNFSQWDVKALAEQIGGVVFPGQEVRCQPAGGNNVLWQVHAGGAAVGRVVALELDAPIWAAPAFALEVSLGLIESADVAPAGTTAYEDGAVQPWAGRRYQPLPTMPAAEFDLALMVGQDVTSEAVERVIRGAAGDLLEGLTLFDRYQGKGVDAGARSLAWRLTFRHPERTLRDKEIEGRRAKILSALETELHVRPRT